MSLESLTRGLGDCILLDDSDAGKPWTTSLETLILEMGRGRETLNEI